ncbi:TonB-dependent receptor [Sphingomonas koreensis]|uniref:TonB-dependent receptor n=1 Tax=Sphingomonas koreensis TaxID=93064 RepID=A0A1L6JG07_9SPHN|nr:TonB-dependent receptor [Sphingomonas koreensis]RSU23063.1 TonB-dependent receptor [Sphingomonas koreensis]RSU26886.1 TonB-dependent receptor [Sphingomonas koreensis]RSU30944.1 TonB-dependent receptor [Sphingomonas koreensis]RSU37050.1 TonB-dependent receptor [Sphingomonas koreensis]
MTVTGTRIRGGVNPSPVVTLRADQIRQEGFADLGDAMRSVPQNFSGGQNPEVPAGNLLQAGIANQNATGGSSLNLRGLGPDATLTLLNGRRLSYSGVSQAFDISAIPVEAIDRVEIVPDGASAIYGSDAVGGVGNVILRRNFDGVAIGARYGGATNGGLTTFEYTATAGLNWTGGGLIFAYKNVAADPIYAQQRDYTDYLPDLATIYPKNDLRSGLISIHQSISNTIDVQIDAGRSVRRQRSQFFIGGTTQYYSIAPRTASFWVTPSVNIELSSNWKISLTGSFGEDSSDFFQTITSLASNATTTLYDYCFCNKLSNYELSAEGRLFDLPGGHARLALGAGYRINKFQQVVKAGAGVLELGGDEASRFAYAEINLPFIGEDSNVPGVRRLAVTAAIRGEHYDSFGRVTTPKVGLIYDPGSDFSIKGSWGKSFKAPTLYQTYLTATALLYPATVLGGSGYPAGATAIYIQGGNPDLKPERATTWTASLEYHPQAIPNLQGELSWFNIDYSDRVVFPFGNATQGLRDPIYAPFVEQSPTAESQSELLASAGSFINATGAPYNPNNVVAILHGRFSNIVRQRIKGIDVSGSYRIDVGPGQLVIRGSGSWIDSSQQLSQGQGYAQLAGTLYNPAKLRGRLGIVWNQHDLTLSTFGNYVSGVKDRASGIQGRSFTTFDATVRYTPGPKSGVLSGLELALTASNVFNRKPPFHTPSNTIYAIPYDPTNYSAVGRFLSFSVSNRW